jgi:hypothetical protein
MERLTVMTWLKVAAQGADFLEECARKHRVAIEHVMADIDRIFDDPSFGQSVATHLRLSGQYPMKFADDMKEIGEYFQKYGLEPPRPCKGRTRQAPHV